ASRIRTRFDGIQRTFVFHLGNQRGWDVDTVPRSLASGRSYSRSVRSKYRMGAGVLCLYRTLSENKLGIQSRKYELSAVEEFGAWLYIANVRQTSKYAFTRLCKYL